MAEPETGPGTAAADRTRGQAVVLAGGSLAQQAAQVAGLLTMLAIITVLARELTLREFGIYGLLTSLAGYLLIVQNAAASGAVRMMAAATDARGRSSAFSTALVLYAGAGLATGGLLALLGVALAAGVDLSDDVERQARIGALLLGAVTAVGWPVTVYRDALRASQLFVLAAAMEIGSLVVYAALVLSLALGGASLSLVIGASGAIPLLAGAACAVAARAKRVPYRFARSTVERATARELGALAGYVSLTEAAAAAIYAIDRVILGLFRSAATVGLFEGPVRAHNLVRALNAAITTTALPAGSRYYAESDQRRLRELLLRGSRYTLALVVPLAVVGMTLAGPILDVWLGARFREAGPAMAIMLSHWLVNGCAGLAAAILIAGGRARELARYALTVACGNIALALVLTPMLGLDGIALATAVPYLAAFPLLLRLTLSVVPVSLAELLTTSFVPAYALGAVLAGGLVALRLLVPLETLEAVVATALGALAAYWAAFFVVWMGPEERELVLVVARLRRPR